jgi:hypothetical protein
MPVSDNLCNVHAAQRDEQGTPTHGYIYSDIPETKWKEFVRASQTGEGNCREEKNKRLRSAGK